MYNLFPIHATGKYYCLYHRWPYCYYLQQNGSWIRDWNIPAGLDYWDTLTEALQLCVTSPLPVEPTDEE